MSKRGQIPKPIFEPCVGGGVYLRVPSWSEFEEWVKLRRNNRGHLQPWEPTWQDKHLTRQSYKTRISQFKSMITSDNGYPFHVFRADDNRLVGACNITFVRRGSLQCAHIGYWIGQEYGRNGFARASLKAALRFAFDDLGLHRLSAAVQASNQASIQLLETTGFVREGLARNYLKIDGRWQDHLIYAKLSTD